MVFRSVAHDPFLLNTSRLEAWAHLPATSSPLLDLLREAIELKKLNNGLMKPTLLDDLVGDIYARLYETVLPDLLAKSNDEESRDRMRVDHLLMNTDGPALGGPSPDPTPLGGDSTVVKQQRFKGVGRREIQRKAEAAISKPPAPPIVAKSSKAFVEAVPQLPQEQGQQHGPAVTLTIKEEAARGAGGSSVPGSVHDSADDESELSDIEEIVEEKIELKPMFPNLVSNAKDDGTLADEGEEDEQGEDEEQE